MSDRKLKEMFERGLFQGEIRFDEPVSAHTSLKIGGSVEIMAFPEDSMSLKNVLTLASREKIPVFVFGAGTNLLVRDGGVEGIAVSLRHFKRIEFIQNNPPSPPFIKGGMGGFITLFVEAGVQLNGLINFAKKNGYSGLEALTGIPGTVGGAIYMNAGSFGTEIKDVITSVTLMKMDGSIVILEKEKLKFSYRSSNIPDDAVILSANLILKKDSPQDVSAHMNEFLKKRKNSQPIGRPSAGCVFKNPAGDFAGRLIEAAKCKGMRVGDVEVSTVHANYFINRGKATCRDFIELMEIVRERVKDYSGITLEPEIKIIGRVG